jgi:integrase
LAGLQVLLLTKFPGRDQFPAAVGLVKPRIRTATTLQAFLSEYFASLSVKAGTATAYDHTRRYLLSHFGADCPVRDIGPADAEKWKQSLQAAGLSPSTVARRVGVARSMFRKALRWKLIDENPFADVRGGGQVNKARMYFVTRAETEKVVAVCPDAQWRLLVALSRYGGLRCPSEHLALTWDCIDWERSRIRVPFCKTEHHEGKDCRYVPLFPELRGPLMEVFEQAEPGTEHVITRYRDAQTNLRTHFTRLIHKAGLRPWPKLWHNLRSSRQTELAERYPGKVGAQRDETVEVHVIAGAVTVWVSGDEASHEGLNIQTVHNVVGIAITAQA